MGVSFSFSFFIFQAIEKDFQASAVDVSKLRDASKELEDVELNETFTILMRWDNALNETNRRIAKLQAVLPKLETFEHQIRSEMEWMMKTKEVIDTHVPDAPEDLPQLLQEYNV